MLTRIAKEFQWEMGHRLPFHREGCENIHGHSYKLVVMLEGEPDGNGVVLDYGLVKQTVQPIVLELDHCFIVCQTDDMMMEVLTRSGLKHVVVPFDSTSENLAAWLVTRLASVFQPYRNVHRLGVRISETARVSAECWVDL